MQQISKLEGTIWTGNQSSKMGLILQNFGHQKNVRPVCLRLKVPTAAGEIMVDADVVMVPLEKAGTLKCFSKTQGWYQIPSEVKHFGSFTNSSGHYHIEASDCARLVLFQVSHPHSLQCFSFQFFCTGRKQNPM